MLKGRLSEVIKNLIGLNNTNVGFGRHLEKVKILSCENGKLKAEFTVEENMTNQYGTLHAAFSSLLLDVLTSCAFLTHPNSKKVGVSVTMYTEYVKSAKIGQTVYADAVSVKVGQTLAFTEMTLSDKETGDLITKGVHTIYVGQL